MVQPVRDDRILPLTRWVLAAVNLALLVAFVVLYLFPSSTRAYFAWEIKPYLTAMFMGAGYISGGFMFLYAIFGQKWHQAKNSLLPVSVFAAVMLVVTLLHYDRFLHGNQAFWAWLVIYIITPFLVPWLWFRNRVTDPGTPEPDDRIVPLAVRRIAGLIGGFSLAYWTLNFLYPPAVIETWPWALTPLTARTISAFGILMSVGGLVLYRELRWSAWRYTIQAVVLWQALLIIASIVRREDFHNGSLLNAFFVIIVLILLAGSVLYAWMELAPRADEALPSSQPTA